MTRMTVLVLAAAFAVFSGAASAVNFGDPAAGKEKSTACAACHGADGNSASPTFPKLAGQYADYLLQSLKEYKSGARQNAIMNGQAANLSLEDMEDLAAYYASQEPAVFPVSAD